MRTVKNIIELKKNIELLDKYLSAKTEPKYSFGLDLVRRGTCFVAAKDNDTYKFYPSRFIGYANNNMYEHLDNDSKNGRETNPAISIILGKKPTPNPELDCLYKEFCEELGFTPNEKGSFGAQRKFWDSEIFSL